MTKRMRIRWMNHLLAQLRAAQNGDKGMNTDTITPVMTGEPLLDHFLATRDRFREVTQEGRGGSPHG
jgi:hypothetical protein